MEISGQWLPHGWELPLPQVPLSLPKQVRSRGQGCSRKLPLHFQASASRKVYKCAQPLLWFRSLEPALPCPSPSLRHVSKRRAPKEHPFLSWTLTLGPISQADLADPRTTVNSQWQPALQTAGPTHFPSGIPVPQPRRAALPTSTCPTPTPTPRSLPFLLRGLTREAQKTHPTSSQVGGEELSPSAERLHSWTGGQLSPNLRFWGEGVHTARSGLARSPASEKARP